MTEISVQQRSAEWFELRQSVSLTASRFGDAIGVGRGKPYHYLTSLLSEDVCASDDTAYPLMAHGIAFEPVIDEAYQLLTGYTTCESGFWVPCKKNVLYNLVGASPDAKVYAKGTQTCIGLAEYKAPVYQMYREKTTVPYAIPRMYMAQMQGQMAVCGKPWCDFMAVCERSREIQLKRVFFNAAYWNVASTKLKLFIQVLKVNELFYWVKDKLRSSETFLKYRVDTIFPTKLLVAGCNIYIVS